MSRPTLALRAVLAGTLVASTFIPSLLQPAHASVVHRVAAGSQAVTGADGHTWEADHGFDGGRTYRTSADISGTADDALYQSERYGMAGYDLAVAEPGTYQVRLLAAENYFNEPGRRVFSVAAEGVARVRDIDLYAEAGKHAAHDITFDVVVDDGVLNLDFTASVNHAKVDGIQVTGATTGSTPDTGGETSDPVAEETSDPASEEPSPTTESPDSGSDAPSAPAPAPATSGVWVSAEELASQPTSGDAWRAVMADARDLPSNGDGADLSDQNSGHDQLTLAAAIACTRTGDAAMCSKARAGVVDAIGTEQGGRWLAIGRNLAGYVIAADLVGLRADGNADSDGSRVDAWIRSFLTMTLSDNNSSDEVPLRPFASGSNASAQEGFAYAAVAAYAGDQAALDRAWDAFRTYACDPTAPDHENIDLRRGVEYGWAHDDANPCAVNPEGTVKDGVRIDGAIINDMRRGGEFQDPPGYTQYPWVGLEGFVPAAVVLHRAGYPAFDVADQAVYRTLDYLWWLRQHTGDARWFDGSRADEAIHLTNVAYGASFLMTDAAVGGGRVVGYVDYTHADQL